LISHRVPLEQAAEAYVWFDTKQNACTKVVFYPDLLPE
jgi:threonine dehydrogenase-like Zn-dependent dehydrogenase